MWGWGRGRIRPAFLILAAAVAVVGFAAADAAKTQGKHPSYDRQVEAAEIMKSSIEAIKRLRLSMGLSIDRQLDPNETGIIGEELTGITTSLGTLEAKRTSANPAFAALLVRYFTEARLAPGDVVAVGASGSFPALIIATLSAAKALNLEPIVIYSIGASMYGATLPELTFADMLACLNREGLIPYRLAAVSPGGEGDSGEGALFTDGRNTLLRIAMRSGAPVICEESVEKSIRRRLEIYRRESRGRPIRCFVNIGGADPNFGSTMASLSFPNGLVMKGPILSASPRRGLVSEFAARGVPVIHLLNIRDLAMKNGIPIDPIPIPPVGEGAVYYVTKYPKGLVWATLAISLIFLAAGKRKDGYSM